MNRTPLLLLLGDTLTILLIILLGFALHQTNATERIQFTLFPFLAAWLLVASVFRLFTSRTLQWNQLWHVPLAMLVAAPLGSWLRSAWLGTPLVPVFVLVMGLTLTLGLLAWRAVYKFFNLRRAKV